MDERFHQRDDVLVEGLDSDACFLLLHPAETVGAEVAELKQKALARLNEEAFFDDVAEFQCAAFTTQQADKFFQIGHDLMILVGYSGCRAARPQPA